MNKYWGFGLNIASELEMPELVQLDFEKADIQIKLGKTPLAINTTPQFYRSIVSMSETEYLLKFPNQANYYVYDGKEIVIEKLEGSDDASVRLFLLSNAMAAILHQRNQILMHASSILTEEGVVLFCGESGAGKSTLVTALLQMNHKVFSDDVCVLKDINNQICVVPSYPMIKLWEDSFLKVGNWKANEHPKLRPELPKYAIYFHEVFNTNPKSIKSIVILEKSKTIDSPSLIKLTNYQSFLELQNHTYRPMQTSAMKRKDTKFKLISSLSQQTTVFKIIRPYNHINSIESILDLIKPLLLNTQAAS